MKKMIALVALSLGISGASASPIVALRGGAPSGAVVGGSGTAYAVDPLGTGVRADFSAGQAYVTWPGPLNAGLADYTKRHRLYRSTTPLNSGNCTSATRIADHILPNYAQLHGGNPNISNGTPYCQNTRQANGLNCAGASSSIGSQANNPMAKLPDMNLGGTQIPAYNTGLQVYTALSSGDAYYCVVQTDTSDANPVYVGSVGPIAESVATPQPILYAHRTTGYGNVNGSTSGFPIVLSEHPSDTTGGAAGSADSVNGDYYEQFGDTTQGWQDGRAEVFVVLKDGVSGNRYPSITGGSILVEVRDTVWNSLGTGAMETYHRGLGLIPNPLVPTTGSVGSGRHYPTTLNGYRKFLSWVGSASGYNGDLNQIHCTGASLGAFGCMSATVMTSPQLASVWAAHPVLRTDLFRTSSWGGESWPASSPFAATVGTAPSVLGTNPAVVLNGDGTSWDDTYGNLTTFWASDPGADLPFIVWIDAKDDTNLSLTGDGTFKQNIDGITALQNAHRGAAFCWFMGRHDTSFHGFSTINADGSNPIAGVSYRKDKFSLIVPYIATDHSSIDDNPGTGARNAAGIVDGDSVGCIGAGFNWTVPTDTSSALNFTLGNSWMGRSATPPRTSTITSNITLPTGGGTVTVADATPFTNTSWAAFAFNPYILIGGTEAVLATSISGNTITYSAQRGILGTTASSHSSGETIEEYVVQALGPNIGAQTTMTVNVTPRRLQGFIKPAGTVIHCDVTPFGAGSSTPMTGTVVGSKGVFTLTGVVINVGGSTAFACS